MERKAGLYGSLGNRSYIKAIVGMMRPRLACSLWLWLRALVACAVKESLQHVWSLVYPSSRARLPSTLHLEFRKSLCYRNSTQNYDSLTCNRPEIFKKLPSASCTHQHTFNSEIGNLDWLPEAMRSYNSFFLGLDLSPKVVNL